MVNTRTGRAFRVGLLVVLVAASPPTAEAKKRIPPCPGGVFWVDGEPLITGGLAVPDSVSVESGFVSLLSGCDATTAKLKGTRRGTKLKARWVSCPGITGRVKLKARIDPSCTSMVGKLRARKLKRNFTAHTRVPQCGDGRIDPGEECDGEGTCAEGATCENCRCVEDLSCGEASVCGGRRYCNEAHDCLCIRSAEGPILCGHRPQSCDVQLCQTSADCAHLGEGYFCDTPNSGCCSDGELPRCIAPCERPPCTPERICGDNCCPEGSGCAGGACCPTARICGEICCSEGEGCEDGKCALPGPCPGDDVTAASLLAADAALEAGATEVALSPGGCSTYRRTLDGGVLASDSLIEAGRVAVETSYTDTGASGREDRNLDGVFDWEAVLTRGTDPEIFVVIRELDFQTGQEVRREERTVKGGTIHVVITQGSTLINQFDTTVEQPDGGLATPAAAPGPCDAAREQRYRDDLKRCMERTPKCLRQHGKNDVAAEMKKIYPKVSFLCGDLPNDSSGNPVYAQANAREAAFGATRTITVNTTRESPSPDFRSSTVCHEVMHFTSLGLHDLGLEDTPRQFEADRVHACENLCGFAFPGTKPSKCQCASCLDSADCDPRCNNKGYRDCNPDMGALCLCPQRHVWYPTLTLCRQECPSGLACAGFFECASLDRGCD